MLSLLTGKGLGKTMLLQTYEVRSISILITAWHATNIANCLSIFVEQLALSRDDIVEVTVEDPAPAFQRMRDSVDFEWAQRRLAQIGRCTSSSSIP